MYSGLTWLHMTWTDLIQGVDDFVFSEYDNDKERIFRTRYTEILKLTFQQKHTNVAVYLGWCKTVKTWQSLLLQYL